MFSQKTLMVVTALVFSFLATSSVLAQTPPSNGGGGVNTSPSLGGGGANTPPSSGMRLVNPLGDDSTITGFLQELLDVIMIFAVPLIVFMIIYAGFKYVMARGNESQVSEASRALLYAVIGGVIILGANIILAVISGTVDAFR